MCMRVKRTFPSVIFTILSVYIIHKTTIYPRSLKSDHADAFQMVGVNFLKFLSRYRTTLHCRCCAHTMDLVTVIFFNFFVSGFNIKISLDNVRQGRFSTVIIRMHRIFTKKKIRIRVSSARCAVS